jgi:hypothetical protein
METRLTATDSLRPEPRMTTDTLKYLPQGDTNKRV